MEKFDWSLSLEEIDKKFGPQIPKEEIIYPTIICEMNEAQFASKFEKKFPYAFSQIKPEMIGWVFRNLIKGKL